MCFATLLPLGIASSTSPSSNGCWEARDLDFLTNDTNAAIEWLRLPGEVIFIAGGALPVLYITFIGIRHTVKRVTLEEPEDILFTAIHEPEGIAATGASEAAAKSQWQLRSRPRGGLRRVPAGRGRRARVAVRAHPRPLAALPHRGLLLRR